MDDWDFVSNSRPRDFDSQRDLAAAGIADIGDYLRGSPAEFEHLDAVRTGIGGSLESAGIVSIATPQSISAWYARVWKSCRMLRCVYGRIWVINIPIIPSAGSTQNTVQNAPPQL